MLNSLKYNSLYATLGLKQNIIYGLKMGVTVPTIKALKTRNGFLCKKHVSCK